MTNKYEKIWQNSNWTFQARNIIEGIENFPKKSKIAIILRHSHRKHSVDAEKLARLTLTPKGREIARIFGTLLPKSRPIRLFHSIVLRCKETAEEILTGFKEIGGKGELIGVLDSLYDIGSDGHFIISKAVEYSGQEFLEKWASEQFPTKKVKPLERYSQESAHEIWNLLNDAPDNGIDVHVSHDLSIMGFRLGWFDMWANDWWVSFLGGLTLTFQEDHILVLDNGIMKKFDIPEWWSDE